MYSPVEFHNCNKHIVDTVYFFVFTFYGGEDLVGYIDWDAFSYVLIFFSLCTSFFFLFC